MKTWASTATLIRMYREKRAISQSALAKKLGYQSAQFISNLERGVCGCPVLKAKQICKILDISHKLMKASLLEDWWKNLQREWDQQ